MKRQIMLGILIVTLGCTSAGFAQWVNVGDGIDYAEFTASGPNNLFVSRLTRSNTNAIIDTAHAYDTMSGSVEIVRNQAARQDDTISWWGGSWGKTVQVVAAVNGGFYDIHNSPYLIQGGQIQGGWYSHSYLDPYYPAETKAAFSGFCWKTDRTAFHGECVSQTGANMYVRFVSTSNNMAINGINIHPNQVTNNKLYIYTPQYNTRTPSATRTEVLVEMSKPNLTTTGSGYSSGTIRSKAQNTGSTWIPFDHLVLSANGDAATTLYNNSSVGAEVRIFQKLVEYNEPDVQGNNACQTTTGVDWGNVFASINTNYHFLKNNVVRVPDAVAHPGYLGYVNLNPRTAICWNANYVFFVVCDGRSTASKGMSCATLGNWAKSVLGATDGVNLDGGGSSTMLINGGVMNVPSDGWERSVCNSIMMLNASPKVQSTQFSTSQTVYTVSSANMRLGPGSNYGIYSTISSGSNGTVVSHSLNGVYAKGHYWWKCTFGSLTGWIAQAYLTGAQGSQPPTITLNPSSQTVSTGGSVVFNVEAVGDGTLSYQWQKNSTNLSNGGHYSGCTTAALTVSSADTNDAASYRCVVSNAYGSDTSNSATLTVEAAGSTFIVESRSGGQNYGNYSEVGTWSDGASKSSASGTTTGIGHRWCTLGATAVSATYSFTPATSGTYAIYTTNCTTDNSGNPLIHKVTHTGGTATVGVCQNTSCGSNAVNKWYLLGQYILNASTAYSVKLDGSTASGTLPAGNAGRSDSIKWSLVSSLGPTITSQPQNQAVVAGGTATFTVAATGTGTLTYQWLKDLTDLSNGGHYSGCTTPTLTVSNVDTNDVDYYACEITDDSGSVVSNEVTLTITTCSNPTMTNGNFEYSTAGSPPYGWTTYIQASKSGAFTIQTATPPQGTRWQQTQVYNTGAFGGVRQNITGLNVGSVYTISGSYRSNSTSATASVRYHLSGNTDRTVSTALASTTSTNWGTFSGTVTASGTSLMLFLDHKNSTSTNKASGFDNVKVEMVCAGVMPTITQQPTAQDVCAGGNVAFTVAATGDAPLSYQWQKNSVNITNGGHYAGATTTTLAVSTADTNDAANYRCVVTNNSGSTTSSQVALTIKAATSIAEQPTNQSIPSGGTAVFTITAEGDGAKSYQWQKNSANVSDGGHYSGVTTPTLTITTADTNDVANYRCVVTAGCGTATSNTASLSLTDCTTASLTNGNFETGTAANPPTGWTTYIQASRSGNWTIQTATPPQGTQWQQTQVYNTSSYGGVRQNVTNLTNGAVYTISGSYKTNSISASAYVRYNLSGDTDRANSTVLAGTSSTNWETFSADVTASGSSLMLFLDHMNGNSSNKAGAFDNIKITCK